MGGSPWEGSQKAAFQVNLKRAGFQKEPMGTHPTGRTWLEQKHKDRWNQEMVEERWRFWVGSGRGRCGEDRKRLAGNLIWVPPEADPEMKTWV